MVPTIIPSQEAKMAMGADLTASPNAIDPVSSSADGLAARTPELSLGKRAYGGTSKPHMSPQAYSNVQNHNATKPSVGRTNFNPTCDKHI
ncbi:uncharacterized protein N7458_004736 [Penicillium daleae]|uniref:Uncharacterized protein n=1 Tax=Penicillium daleae TaxID=63821 RepID=A0AAD6C713_9EURO|nr:uncharacterized protein N7458_004736 [Penicillium daleae]KAJ5453780.1 hypothetical protein N7458_004736 [Penicillium daleae]